MACPLHPSGPPPPQAGEVAEYKAADNDLPLSSPGDKVALEHGAVITPRFDAQGLVACVATHADTGEVLMLAWMNAEALKQTLDTGEAHYFSRSRQTLWKKGETSGQIQIVRELSIDCDQDAVWIKVSPQGDGGACHTGARSCFYRVWEDGRLVVRS